MHTPRGTPGPKGVLPKWVLKYLVFCGVLDSCYTRKGFQIINTRTYIGAVSVLVCVLETLDDRPTSWGMQEFSNEHGNTSHSVLFLMGTPARDWACQAAMTGERGGKCLTRFRTVLLAGSGVGKRRQRVSPPEKRLCCGHKVMHFCSRSLTVSLLMLEAVTGSSQSDLWWGRAPLHLFLCP